MNEDKLPDQIGNIARQMVGDPTDAKRLAEIRRKLDNRIIDTQGAHDFEFVLRLYDERTAEADKLRANTHEKLREAEQRLDTALDALWETYLHLGHAVYPNYVREQAEAVLREELAGANASLTANRAALDTAHEQIERVKAERDRYKIAYDEWEEKTDWIQDKFLPRELGKHRADAIRQRLATALDALEKIHRHAKHWNQISTQCVRAWAEKALRDAGRLEDNAQTAQKGEPPCNKH